jgi:hypothetical protein
MRRTTEIRDKAWLERSALDEARLRAADFPNRFAWTFTIVGGAAGAAVATMLLANCTGPLCVLWATLGAVGGIGLVWVTVLVVEWIRMPTLQRNNLRKFVGGAQDLHGRIKLEGNLKAVLGSTSNTIGELRKQERAGPIGEDEVPWISGAIDNAVFHAENLGYPEIASRIAVDHSAIKTWKDAEDVGWEFMRRITEVLAQPMFQDTHAVTGEPPY